VFEFNYRDFAVNTELEKLQAVFDSLHDAIFIDFSFDWETSLLIVRCKPCDFCEYKQGRLKILEIHALSVLSLSITQKNDWGPSVFIYEVKLSAANHADVLSIGIQSGDVMLIEAKSFSYRMTTCPEFKEFN
jgi:hypothetical protein